jgi:hypothetical protein
MDNLESLAQLARIADRREEGLHYLQGMEG